MTDHLPECTYHPGYPEPVGPMGPDAMVGKKPCICDRLRACEQRVREEENRNVIGSVSLAAIGEANLQQYQLGFADALDAARAAVARIAVDEGDACWRGCLNDALAAIDALREGAK